MKPVVGKIRLDADVFSHRGRGNFLDIRGVAGGIVITPKVEREVKLNDKPILIKGLEIVCPFLEGVLELGETTRTWVGRKFDGIYIGFQKGADIQVREESCNRVPCKAFEAF